MTHLYAVVLAAGAGRRFGGQKLLAPWKGVPLIHAALDRAAGAPVERVLVVTGCDADGVSDAVRAWAQSRRVPAPILIQAPDHRDGLAASLRTGIRSIPHEAKGAFVFLGDMPRIPADVPDRLRLALTDDHWAAVPVFQGRRGHPALVTSALFSHIEALSGDAGAGGLLDRLGGRIARVDVDDDGILFDVDERKDLGLQHSEAR